MRKGLLLTLALTACTAVMPPYATAQTAAQAGAGLGVYDLALARVAAEKVLSTTKKILALNPSQDHATINSFTRYINIKEEQAQLVKIELLLLWVEYFKPKHLADYPDLHDTIWNAAKLCSAVQVEVSLEKAEDLMNTVEKIHNIYWDTKGRDVPFIRSR